MTIQNFITAIQQNAMTILTFLLVIITGVYAYFTWNVAKTMGQQFNLQSMPYATLDEGLGIIVQAEGPDLKKLAETTRWLRIIFTIKNVGNVPIEYTHDNIYFNEEKDLSPGASGSSIIYPGQSIKYFSKQFKLPPTKPQDIKGDANIKITYWALGLPKNKYFHERTYSIGGIDGVSWAVGIINDKGGNQE